MFLRLIKHKFFISFLISAFTLSSCAPNEDPISQQLKFEDVKKIDVHVHIDSYESDFLQQAIADNFQVLSINTNSNDHNSIEKQREWVLAQIKSFPGQIAFATTFTVDGWDDPGWTEKTIAYLEKTIGEGAVAVKIWKNIGMETKDKQGHLIMIDNPRFDPIFEYLIQKGIPIVGHLGEPKNCWLPMKEITLAGDKAYYRKHPQYYMHLHPDYPSYEDQINARDRVLQRYPYLRFIGCHLGSLEWNVDKLAECLNRFDNMAVDMASRIAHLQLQSMKDRKKIRDFFIKYQDRILYGTDLLARQSVDADKMKTNIHRTWLEDWKYFTTDVTLTSWQFEGEFQGLALPPEVIKKIYRLNALNWYPRMKNDGF